MDFLAQALMGLLYTALWCAVVILIAWAIYWVLVRLLKLTDIDMIVYWGRIVVGLICAIIVVGFLLSLLGGAVQLGTFHPYGNYARHF